MIATVSQALIFISVVLVILALRRFYLELQVQFTENVRLSMEEILVFIDPAKVFQVTLLLLVVLPIGVWLVARAWPAVFMVALATACLPAAVYRVMRTRRLQKMVDQMPDALAMLAGSLRAGVSLQTALSMVVNESPAPLSQEFSMVLREQRLGMTLQDSLANLGQRFDVEDIALFVSAVTIARDVGGNLAEILDGLAGTLRTKATMEGKIRALTAQGKMQGWVVGLLPLMMGLVLYVMDPAAMRPMFTTTYGWIVLALVSILLLLGALFIRKIVKIDI